MSVLHTSGASVSVARIIRGKLGYDRGRAERMLGHLGHDGRCLSYSPNFFLNVAEENASHF